MRDREPLFQKYDFPANVRAAVEKLRAAVDALPDRDLMAEDLRPLVDRLVKDHMFEIAVLSPDKVTVDEGEVKIDVSRDPRRAIFDRSQPFYLKGTEYRFYVPFSGQKETFFCHPSTYDFNPPYAEVDEHHIVIRVTRSDGPPDPGAIRKEFEQVLGAIETNLQRLRDDVNGLEDRLRKAATERIDLRREKRQRDAAVIDQLGFPKRGS